MTSNERLITLDDVRAARTVIGSRLHRTPMMGSTTLGARAGVRVQLKLELFQKTGSFKPRGVLNNLHHLSEADKARGVITLSAGNHAQALAWAAREIGVPATVVMPASAVQSKVDATRGYGGEVILTDGNLLDTTLAIQKERGLTLVHPFDHLMTIAGAGTTGLELMEDMPEVDVVVVGCGGGGLISGVAAVVKLLKPNARVVGVEPEGAPGMTLSLQRGEAATLERVSTVADGLAAPFVGKHNLAHVQAFVDDMVLVSDDEIVAAMRVLMERCKVMAEPAAAACVAALLGGKTGAQPGASVACIISGGNVDLARLKAML